MYQDEHLSMPNRRTTSAGDHAERVQNDLVNHALARQAYEQQQQHQASIPTRRERKYCIEKGDEIGDDLSFSGHCSIRRTTDGRRSTGIIG